MHQRPDDPADHSPKEPVRLDHVSEEIPLPHELRSPDLALATLAEYHAALQGGTFDPLVKDGLRTRGLAIDKTNWAQPLDTPPFDAYATTCGITFTFGGLRIVKETGQVMNVHFHPIPGLYCAGEMVGGLFYFNYPSGTGLVSGAVFGRLAGASAAQAAQNR